MIVWQGAGILGGIIPILFYLLTGMAVRAMTGITTSRPTRGPEP
jgi:hypothetical protein